VASPKGGETILDPVSVELFKDDSICTEFKATKENLWKNTEELEDFLGKAADCDAILYIGGFGRKFYILNYPAHLVHLKRRLITLSFSNVRSCRRPRLHQAYSRIPRRIDNGFRTVPRHRHASESPLGRRYAADQRPASHRVQ